VVPLGVAAKYQGSSAETPHISINNQMGNQDVRRRRQDMTHAKDLPYVTSDFIN
jgi:hypothetical protein